MTTNPPPDPSQLPFVLNPDTRDVEVERLQGFDLHLPRARTQLPAVVFVHDPVAGDAVRPRQWPLYRGYATSAANAGLAGAVVDLDYTDFRAISVPAAQLAALVEEIRAHDAINADRVAIWAFSAGALLVGQWLDDQPLWVRCVALTYPVVASPDCVVTPLVVTRVGRERPEIQAMVDQLLDRAAGPVEVINVAEGQHGFDVLDHHPESEAAVRTAIHAVASRLRA